VNPWEVINILDIGEKLLLLDDENKDVFRWLLISEGINWIIASQKKGMDFIQLSSSTAQEMDQSWVTLNALLVLFTTLIDLIDQTNGDGLTSSQLNHAFASPLEFVKFFHTRSSCDCLKDLYYN
jgi:hypothetical protein